MCCAVSDDKTQFIQEIIDDDDMTHEQWLDIVHVCQTYGYHDCAMDILTCVTELFAANKHAPTINRDPLQLIDDRRYRPVSPLNLRHLSDNSITWPRRQNTQRPPVKPASLPSLKLSDNERRNTKKRRKKWANSRPTTASDADAEFSDATTTDLTQ